MQTYSQTLLLLAFKGSWSSRIEHMIDLEDRKQGDMIFSTDMIHFIIEHFDSTDLKLVYARQRLFTAIVKEVLGEYRTDILRQGDDLFVDGKKAHSVYCQHQQFPRRYTSGCVVHDYYGSLEDLGLGSDDVANGKDCTSILQ
ncbi:MAG: DUF366 family protein [Methanolobus sp.]